MRRESTQVWLQPEIKTNKHFDKWEIVRVYERGCCLRKHVGLHRGNSFQLFPVTLTFSSSLLRSSCKWASIGNLAFPTIGFHRGWLSAYFAIALLTFPLLLFVSVFCSPPRNENQSRKELRALRRLWKIAKALSSEGMCSSHVNNWSTYPNNVSICQNQNKTHVAWFTFIPHHQLLSLPPSTKIKSREKHF